ncbi:MAG: hypothetical protein ACYC7B_11010 [Burkholderiales bacterium]
MSEIPDNFDWSLTGWEGSRRAQLRRWCALRLRQRLLALEQMTEIAEHFGRMREMGKMREPTAPKKQTSRCRRPAAMHLRSFSG